MIFLDYIVRSPTELYKQ